MTNLTDELVEKAARAICLNRGMPACRCDKVCAAPGQVLREHNPTLWEQARAALSAVLPDVIAAERDRAAKVAEELPVGETVGGDGAIVPVSPESHADAIAAAIRGDA